MLHQMIKRDLKGEELGSEVRGNEHRKKPGTRLFPPSELFKPDDLPHIVKCLRGAGAGFFCAEPDNFER